MAVGEFCDVVVLQFPYCDGAHVKHNQVSGQLGFHCAVQLLALGLLGVLPCEGASRQLGGPMVRHTPRRAATAHRAAQRVHPKGL